MDTNKWKSVLVPKDVYLKIKEIAKLDGRTIGGQLRHIFSHYKSEDQQRVEERVEAQMKRANHSAADTSVVSK